MRTRNSALSVAMTSLMLWGCASAGSADEPPPDGLGRTHYTLRKGAALFHGSRLPAQTDIYVDWHYSDGSTRSTTGFRAWDFLGDGRYQMVDVLNEDGTTATEVFDFAGDGRVDQTVLLSP